MQVNLLLIVLPRHYETEKQRKENMAARVVPYGALSIASYVKAYSKSSVNVEILDFNIYNCSDEFIENKIKEIIKRKKPDIVGISVIFNEAFYYIKQVVKVVKKVSRDILVIAGGVAGTNLYKEVFQYSEELDATVFSEGEIPILDLIDSENWKKTLHLHQSFLTRDDYEHGKLPKATFVENLDDLPLIDFSLVDLSEYGARAALTAESYRALPIHTSRGCPFNCIFCAAASVHGKKFRKMSSERVLTEIKNMVEKYNINHVQIDDDQFLLDKKRAKDILQGMVQLPYKLIPEFDSGFSPRYIDEDIISKLKALDVEYVTLAIESGSERVLKEIIDKPLTNREAIEKAELVLNGGLRLRAFFVVGLPNETDDERLQTKMLAQKLNLDWAWFSIAAPFKGSRLYDICLDNKYISDIYDAAVFSLKKSVITTMEFSAEHISKQAYLFNLEVNFLKNKSLLNADWKRADYVFDEFTKRLPSHAFAWRCLAKANYKLGNIKKYKTSISNYFELIKNDLMWKEYAKYFGLEIDRSENFKEEL